MHNEKRWDAETGFFHLKASSTIARGRAEATGPSPQEKVRAGVTAERRGSKGVCRRPGLREAVAECGALAHPSAASLRLMAAGAKNTPGSWETVSMAAVTMATAGLHVKRWRSRDLGGIHQHTHTYTHTSVVEEEG